MLHADGRTDMAKLTVAFRNFANALKATQSMLYSEIIAVSQTHAKHINTLCGQNVELLNVKLVVRIVTAGLKGLTQFQIILQQLSEN
jgi:hypothetical protein